MNQWVISASNIFQLIDHLLESYSDFALVHSWPFLDLLGGDAQAWASHLLCLLRVSSQLTNEMRKGAQQHSSCAFRLEHLTVLWNLSVLWVGNPRAEPLHSLSELLYSFLQASCLPLFPCLSKTLFLENFSFITHILSASLLGLTLGLSSYLHPHATPAPTSLLTSLRLWDSSECCHTYRCPSPALVLCPCNTVDQWVSGKS